MSDDSIHIIHCGPDSRCFDRFLQVPHTLYDKATIKLQSLNDGINTDYLFACLVATHDNIPVGRCALYQNPHLLYEGKTCMTIGNYECSDAPGVSDALIAEAKRMAKENGAEMLIGPMNGSTWDAYRFCTNPGADVFFLEPYHQPFYAAQFEVAGFAPIAEYVSTIDRKLLHDAPAVVERDREFMAQGFRFRNIRLDQYEQELQLLYDFCCRSFAGNFLYTPVSREVFFSKYKAIKPFIIEEYVMIAEYPDGRIAGFVFCFPDHVQANEKRMVLKTLARDMVPETKGLGNVIGNRMTKLVKEKGFTSMIHALIHIDNRSKNLSAQYSGELLKTYALYAVTL